MIHNRRDSALNKVCLRLEQSLPPPWTNSASALNKLCLRLEQSLPLPWTNSASALNKLCLRLEQSLPAPWTKSASALNKLCLCLEQSLKERNQNIYTMYNIRCMIKLHYTMKITFYIRVTALCVTNMQLQLITI